MNKLKQIKKDYIIIFLYFTLFLVIGISLLVKQPFGNPPDEYNRYLIPEYIATHGTLPNGYDEAIRIPGYGFSYGFQPILPYMAQGYSMRLVRSFTSNETTLLYTARSVNLLFGLITAFFVLLLSRKWFSDKKFGYLFAFLVTFLPQSIFIHTYVNTDSCCMMSIAIMLYGLTCGISDHFAPRSSVCMSAGIILCALSYYNAYGFILSCILLFTANFLSLRSYESKRRLSFSLKPFLTKGGFICVLVLLGISWWFIRSYLLYDGDFLGLESRDNCGLLYAIPSLHPDTRITYANQGYTILEMLRNSDFINLSTLSFIGIYGPMTIITALWVYHFYKLLFSAGILLCLIFLYRKKSFPDTLYSNRSAFRYFYHINMVFCILMPCILSLYYSYTTDYQPQGRYLLPALIPLCYYCIRGIQKTWYVFVELLQKKKPIRNVVLNHFLTGLCILLCIMIIICLLVTVYGYAFPYYDAHPIAD